MTNRIALVSCVYLHVLRSPPPQLLVMYIDNLKDFECIYVSTHATDTEIIQHREISVKLDMTGVGNRGLFLKLRDSEQPFGLGESPCDVLFEMRVNMEN